MRNLTNLAREHGIDLHGVAVAVVLSAAVALLAADVVLLAWHGLLPGLFVLGGLPLVLGGVMLLSSDIGLTDEERLDRHLGLSFRGKRRTIAQAAYADLWIDEEQA
ncbi:hypothetical protein WK35_25305 [Burkholderia vietnamiensis]|uniref:hypothetical protein n=1 Tax=Burkholderia vietnamiensis TaxID=60552 RepID=UPI0007621BF9|nr:hypothetical protein [Burkholderia vietnamiensis]KVS42070.1 hypothetical protein WK35_25305 [Burkholderia vietnamiensis]